jgi:hypothetical protein
MKEQIKKLKSELKQIAKQIKQQKSIRKPSHTAHDKYIGHNGIATMSSTFRHKHVAYCLARGRTLEQVDSGGGLNMEWVNFILESMKPEAKNKLYVVVNDKLTPSQQAVQAGHAVAEFLKKYPNTMWDNGYLIYLKESPVWYDTMTGSWNLKCYTQEYVEFKEPDLGNKVTAYCSFGPEAEKVLAKHKLL